MDSRAHRWLALTALALGGLLVADVFWSASAPRSRRVFADIAVDDITSLTFDFGSGDRITIGRAAGDAFALSTNGRADLRQQTVDDFIGALELAAAARTRSSTADRDPEAASVTIERRDGTPVSFSVAAAESQNQMVWLTRDDRRRSYLIERHFARELAPQRSQLVERRPFEVGGRAILEIAIESAGQRRVWRQGPPPAQVTEDGVFVRPYHLRRLLLLLSKVTLVDGEQIDQGLVPPLKVELKTADVAYALATRGGCKNGIHVETSARGQGCVSSDIVEELRTMANAPLTELVSRRLLPDSWKENQLNLTLIVGDDASLWPSESSLDWFRRMSSGLGPAANLPPGRAIVTAEIALVESVSNLQTVLFHLEGHGKQYFVRRNQEPIAFAVSRDTAAWFNAVDSDELLLPRDPGQLRTLSVNEGNVLREFSRGRVLGEWMINGQTAGPEVAGVERALRYLEAVAPAWPQAVGLGPRDRTFVLRYGDVEGNKAETVHLRVGTAMEDGRCACDVTDRATVWTLDADTCEALLAPL